VWERRPRRDEASAERYRFYRPEGGAPTWRPCGWAPAVCGSGAPAAMGPQQNGTGSIAPRAGLLHGDRADGPLRYVGAAPPPRWGFSRTLQVLSPRGRGSYMETVRMGPRGVWERRPRRDGASAERHRFYRPEGGAPTWRPCGWAPAVCGSGALAAMGLPQNATGSIAPRAGLLHRDRADGPLRCVGAAPPPRWGFSRTAQVLSLRGQGSCMETVRMGPRGVWERRPRRDEASAERYRFYRPEGGAPTWRPCGWAPAVCGSGALAAIGLQQNATGSIAPRAGLLHGDRADGEHVLAVVVHDLSQALIGLRHPAGECRV